MNSDAELFGDDAPPGCAMTSVVILPADDLEYDEREWAAAMVVVERGRVLLECWSGAQAYFDTGAVLFFTRLNLRRMSNPDLTPVVLKRIRLATGPDGANIAP